MFIIGVLVLALSCSPSDLLVVMLVLEGVGISSAMGLVVACST